MNVKYCECEIFINQLVVICLTLVVIASKIVKIDEIFYQKGLCLFLRHRPRPMPMAYLRFYSLHGGHFGIMLIKKMPLGIFFHIRRK